MSYDKENLFVEGDLKNEDIHVTYRDKYSLSVQWTTKDGDMHKKIISPFNSMDDVKEAAIPYMNVENFHDDFVKVVVNFWCPDGGMLEEDVIFNLGWQKIKRWPGETPKYEKMMNAIEVIKKCADELKKNESFKPEFLITDKS